MESLWKKWIIGDAFNLRNRDPRWYVDKYAFWLFYVAFAALLAGLAKWPLRQEDVGRSAKWVIVAAVAALVTREKSMILTGVLALMAARALLFGFLLGRWEGWLVGIILAIPAWLLFRRMASAGHEPSYRIQEMTVLELGIDMFAFCWILYFLVQLT